MTKTADSGMPRRGFLKKGLLGAALLVTVGSLPIVFRSTRISRTSRRQLKLFSEAEYAIFAAVAARVVPGDSAGPAWPSAESLDCAGKTDELLSRCHPDVGRDFVRLLRLFENGLTGVFTDGRPTPFTRLDPQEQDARLNAWRHSRISLLRSGYQAMVRLSHATYYSSPETFALVGYPGPGGD